MGTNAAIDKIGVEEYAALRATHRDARKILSLSKKDDGRGVREILGEMVSKNRDAFKEQPAFDSALEAASSQATLPRIGEKGGEKLPVVKMEHNFFMINSANVYLVCQAEPEFKEWKLKSEVASILAPLSEEAKSHHLGVKKKWKNGAPTERYIANLHVGDLADLLYDAITYKPLEKSDFEEILHAKISESAGAQKDFVEVFGKKPTKTAIKGIPFYDLLEFDSRISLNAISPFFEKGGYTIKEEEGYRLMRGVSAKQIITSLPSSPFRQELEGIGESVEKAQSIIEEIHASENLGVMENLAIRSRLLFYTDNLVKNIEKIDSRLDVERIVKDGTRQNAPLFSRFISLQFSSQTSDHQFLRPTFSRRSVEKILRGMVDEGWDLEDFFDKKPLATIAGATLDYRDGLELMEIRKEQHEERILDRHDKNVGLVSGREQKESIGTLSSIIGQQEPQGSPRNEKSGHAPEYMGENIEGGANENPAGPTIHKQGSLF